jgi:ABC-2 type transport system ATP-binding protein
LPGIEIDGLVKTFRAGRVRALDGVSLRIEPGEAFGIIGPNGAGKTTLLGCLLGFLTPDAGRIALDGHGPDSLSVRRVTGYLPERLVLDRWMTGGEFLEYHHALAGLPAAGRAAETRALFGRVGLAPEAASLTVARYSRGMLQRLGLAQALLGRPRYLFLDEPISGVDPSGVMLFRRLLGELKGHGVTLIINSHQLDEVERICDRVAFVRAGKVTSIETPTAGATVERVVVVRWAASTPATALVPAALAAAAQAAGAALLGANPPAARFSVPDDDGAARLLERLLAAGVRVSEASPEGGRLERLFTEGAEPGATGGAQAPAAAASPYAPPAAGGAA